MVRHPSSANDDARVPDAVQRDARAQSVRLALTVIGASRCAADPGPPQAPRSWRSRRGVREGPGSAAHHEQRNNAAHVEHEPTCAAHAALRPGRTGGEPGVRPVVRFKSPSPVSVCLPRHPSPAPIITLLRRSPTPAPRRSIGGPPNDHMRSPRFPARFPAQLSPDPTRSIIIPLASRRGVRARDQKILGVDNPAFGIRPQALADFAAVG